MLNRNKHPYKIDERFLSGKVVVMYVRYRFFHNWVFIALTLFWLSFSLLIFSRKRLRVYTLHNSKKQ